MSCFGIWNVLNELDDAFHRIPHAEKGCLKEFHQITCCSWATPEDTQDSVQAEHFTTLKRFSRGHSIMFFMLWDSLWTLQAEQPKAYTTYSSCSQGWIRQCEADVTLLLYTKASMHFVRAYANRSHHSRWLLSPASSSKRLTAVKIQLLIT